MQGFKPFQRARIMPPTRNIKAGTLRAAAVLTLAMLVGSCAPVPSFLDRVLAAGELTVVTRNSPTTFYFGGADEQQGIEFELARRFADYLGVELRIYASDRLQSLIPEVVAGRADIAAGGLGLDASKFNRADFGPGYRPVEQLLIYRMGRRRPKTLEDVANTRIEAVAGSMASTVLAEEFGRNEDLEWISRTSASTETLVRRVVAEQIDYAVVPSSEFAVLRHYYPEALSAFSIGTGTELAWALPQNAPSLKEAVSAFFAEISATGELAKVLAQDQHSAHEFDFVGSRAFVRHLHQRYPRYHEYFRLAALETGLDWRLVAAIAYQESHWDASAVSPTGVRGLMMLTERTAGMVGISDRSDPWESILGGARYFERVLDKFPNRIPEKDRLWLATAAYNIGFGHVEDARIITEIQGGDPDSWDDVKLRLPLLADEAWHTRVKRGYAAGRVPVGYVANVRRYLALIDWMQGTEFVTGVDGYTPITEPGS